ncbi:hypothetical protein KL86PLE_110038 [uncultured Pleomorphomonas sp.]|uniref:Uncharacterized protein n=1 Tax=uncultured Pleomorphomonas sp. TaxID=442121 RepID=A0A212L781_9HYPH|nr:hypothetical protein [uncultured Pleomorphomonas sp.]SCM73365.1 hypothetical protein KL86PLE_110038 [uncultured Pleomorphomonas sp.]
MAVHQNSTQLPIIEVKVFTEGYRSPMASMSDDFADIAAHYNDVTDRQLTLPSDDESLDEAYDAAVTALMHSGFNPTTIRGAREGLRIISRDFDRGDDVEEWMKPLLHACIRALSS